MQPGLGWSSARQGTGAGSKAWFLFQGPGSRRVLRSALQRLQMNDARFLKLRPARKIIKAKFKCTSRDSTTAATLDAVQACTSSSPACNERSCSSNATTTAHGTARLNNPHHRPASPHCTRPSWQWHSRTSSSLISIRLPAKLSAHPDSYPGCKTQGGTTSPGQTGGGWRPHTSRAAAAPGAVPPLCQPDQWH